MWANITNTLNETNFTFQPRRRYGHKPGYIASNSGYIAQKPAASPRLQHSGLGLETVKAILRKVRLIDCMCINSKRWTEPQIMTILVYFTQCAEETFQFIESISLISFLM